MSSSDEQPVKPKIRYAIHLDTGAPLHVVCDDIESSGTYVRFYDDDVPAAIVPANRLLAVVRVEQEAAK